jgi:GNAT superfamily N-acetyltransferase
MNIRIARKEDLESIVKMISNDKFGKLREDFRHPLPEVYLSAFEKITKDINQELVVLENEKNEVIGTMQLSFIQYLTYKGGIRAQIEAVRIREDQRGKGVGQKMFVWAIEKAKQRGAHLLQLTTDKKRPKTIGFYKKLGFIATHEGMKLHFESK